jgi:DNA-binding CsgD family transcriptional regulator
MQKTEALRELTKRELIIVRMISEGTRYKVIGRLLGISHKTVENHKKNAMRKRGLKTTVELIRYVMREESQSEERSASDLDQST